MAKRLAALILLIVGATSCDGGPPPDRPAPSDSATEAPHAGDYSKAEYEVDVTRGLLVPMRDGVHLSVDIYTPQEQVARRGGLAPAGDRVDQLLRNIRVRCELPERGRRSHDRAARRRGSRQLRL